MSAVQRILILAANPRDSSRLRLEEEVRQIDEVLRSAKQREQFELKTWFATRPKDIQQELLDYEPHIVHFCGHGVGGKGGALQGLVFEDLQGQSQLVSAKALADLFELFAQQVKCVVLNACYSEKQAQAIVRHIDAVVGMNQPIQDDAAIHFAEGFYRALGAGKDVEFAYKLGCNALVLENIPADQIPVLKRKSQTREVPEPENTPSLARARVFISYKRNVDPDERIAKQLVETLQPHHDVFIDQTMKIGTPWAERIEAEIQQSDCLIVLLSEHSVHSEMVEHEVHLAQTMAAVTGRPRILPVRLAYRKPFQYPLSRYLDPLNWAMWSDDSDTEQLLRELRDAIQGDSLSIADETAKGALLEEASREMLPQPLPSAQPVPLESPEQGTMALESQVYIERMEDERAKRAVSTQEGTVIIKGARQMGKSSLLNRMVAQAVEQERQIVFLDFQLFGQPALDDRERFFRQFCSFLSDELELPNRIGDYWQEDASLSQICTSYMGRYLLKTLDAPLVLAMDEVDRVLNTEFRSDFFGMLRSWHNKRATAIGKSKRWRKFSQILVISTEPYQLIEDLNQSPFNVGQTLRLQDFNEAQVAVLNQRHDCLLNPVQMGKLMTLLAGHPYLVRRALYLIATGEYTPEQFFEVAGSDHGPFGGHLRRHLFRLSGKTPLVEALLRILHHQTYSDDQIIWRLEGAGLVKKEGNLVVPRCQLYADYLKQHLHR